MRIVSGKIYALRIPFVEAFSHSLNVRKFSDSLVVRLTADDGTIGYGEGLARQYVTGETVESSIEHIKNKLFHAVQSEEIQSFDQIDEILPNEKSPGSIVWNAARAAVELALIDCWLKSNKLSLSAILPPKRNFVTYSGVITAGTIEKAVQHAKRFKLFGIKQLKIKIGTGFDHARVSAIRQAVDEETSLRLDANGAFDVKTAIETAEKLCKFKIDSFEQPIPRGNLRNLAEVRANSPIPLMADESLLTVEDAKKIIEFSACDFFNLRLSKCGGIFNTLQLARLAEENKIRIQIGCQVGETAILSAAARHVIAFLNNVEFSEGSYGNLLLTEDIARDSVNFSHGGRAPLLRGAGFGIEVREDVLEKYAHSIINLGNVTQASCLPFGRRVARPNAQPN